MAGQRCYFLLILFIAVIFTIPWSGKKPFHTKGEPREAITAQAMIESGNWVLPTRYEDNIATKPPLLHWMIGVFSLVNGEVTTTTSRLPSALSYIIAGIAFFSFLSKRAGNKKAFIATFILLTTMQWYHGGMAARVDMLLTVFIICSMLELFKWEEKELKGIPWLAILCMSLGSLTKGPVGIVLPSMVFLIYLLVRRYSYFSIFKSLALTTLLSAILPALWYVAAWKIGGDEFLAIVYDENIARFTSNMKLGGKHENSNFYMLGTLLSGFIPWSLMAVMAGFAHISKIRMPKADFLNKCGNSIMNMDKYRQYSFIASVSIIFFYAIPESKRGVYLMPAYPFICVFVTELIIYIIENKPGIWRFFSNFIGYLIILFSLVITAFTLGWDPSLKFLPDNIRPDVLFYTGIMQNIYSGPGTVINILITLVFFTSVIIWKLRTKIISDIIPGTPFFVMIFGVILYMSAVFQPRIGDFLSVKELAERIKTDNTNQTELYSYGRDCFVMSFYLNERFTGFEPSVHKEGILIIGEKELAGLEEQTKETHTYHILEKSLYPYTDIRQTICVVEFKQIDSI